jgi:hypothetical protein
MDIRGNPVAGRSMSFTDFLFLRDHREVQFRIDRHAREKGRRQFPDQRPAVNRRARRIPRGGG